MAAHSDEHERTMAFADIALGQIKALRQPAIPKNYEIWYTYATGYNPSLNETINETLQRQGTLTTKDLDDIYDTYLSPQRFTDRIDSVGAKVVDEIEQVMAMIGAAVGQTSSYTESLVDVSQQLGSGADQAGLRSIVETLVRSTREVEETNNTLEERLKASKEEIIQLQEHLETVRNESLTDPLTGLANRKYFDQMLERALADTKPTDEPLSLMLTDIDHFKKFNDTFGHLTGDQVLRLVAQAVKQNVKGQDIAARYGGEEFAIILPNTGLRQALTVADHIRRGVVSKELIKRSTGENLGRVTISVGVAMLHHGESVQAIIERADACLYAAKRNGRNQVICETDPEVSPPAESQVA
jgi:diguanylate cyclase